MGFETSLPTTRQLALGPAIRIGSSPRKVSPARTQLPPQAPPDASVPRSPNAGDVPVGLPTVTVAPG